MSRVQLRHVVESDLPFFWEQQLGHKRAFAHARGEEIDEAIFVLNT